MAKFLPFLVFHMIGKTSSSHTSDISYLKLFCLPCFYPRPTAATNAILAPSAEYNNNYYDYDHVNAASADEVAAMKADVIVGKPIPQSSGGRTSQGYI